MNLESTWSNYPMVVEVTQPGIAYHLVPFHQSSSVCLTLEDNAPEEEAVAPPDCTDCLIVETSDLMSQKPLIDLYSRLVMELLHWIIRRLGDFLVENLLGARRQEWLLAQALD